MTLYDIGTKVVVSNPHSGVDCKRNGTVAGHSHLHSVVEKGASPVYLIRLDESFPTPPAGDMYVSVIVVQPDCVKPINSRPWESYPSAIGANSDDY